MSILKFLGIQHVDSTGDSTVTQDDVDGTVQRIANELDAIPDDRALYLATFAYILGRAAHADSHVSKDETQKMQNIVLEKKQRDRELVIWRLLVDSF